MSERSPSTPTARAEPASAANAQLRGRRDPELVPVKCLLVDDREDNLRVLSALLRQDGVELLTARSGREALELLLVHDVALALLDVQMPDMDGFELAELMRGTERTRRVPLIFVTAAARDQARTFKGYDSGAVDFLYKPIEPHVLLSKADVFFRLYRQQHQLAQQLEERTEALRVNELFTAALGHDLRSPLAAIVNGAELLRGVSDDPTVTDVVSRIHSCARRMARMIDDMTDLARSRLVGGLRLSPEPVDLHEIVERVVRDHQGPTLSRAIDLGCDGRCTGRWDPGHMARIVANLIGNALEHGDRERPVTVRVDGTAAERVVLEVENGGSIPQELLPELFEPFRGRSRPGGGLGLGLYIVREIAAAHGGTVDVHQPPGRTAFRVTLPRDPPV